jgi:hypothetical protein
VIAILSEPADPLRLPSLAVEALALTAAWLVAGVNGLAALVGAAMWWWVQPSRLFWALARSGQVLAIAQALLAGGLYLSGFRPDNGLYWLYALLPVLIGFMAEGIRIASAQEVLEQRGLEDARAVGELDEAGQRSVVVAILRREMGVAAIAAGVVAFLALRAVVEI